MDESNNISPQKSSPLIIKLSCPSTSKQPDVTSGEPVIDPQPLTPSKPLNVQMKPVALTFCRLSKDGVLSKSPEPLKISPALSLKLGAALRKRIPLRCLPNQKVTVDPKLDKANEPERQSLTSHSSKLADDRLDFVYGGDKSQVLQLSQPPLTMQPSNLHTDDLLDAKYGGGGSETSVVQTSSAMSPVASSSVTGCTKKHLASNDAEMEPASKKIKLSDAIQILSEPQSESLIGVKTKNLSTKKPKIIEFRNPPSSKQICVEPSVYVLGKGGLEVAPSQQMLPPASLSSVKNPKDVSAKLELAKMIDSKKSEVVKTDSPFIVLHSSNSSEFDNKKESSAEILKNFSPDKSKHSDICQESVKYDSITLNKVKIDDNIEGNDASPVNVNQRSIDCSLPGPVDISQLNENLNSIEYSLSGSSDNILNSNIATNINVSKTKNKDSIIYTKEVCENDNNLSSNPETACPSHQSAKKVLNFNLESSKESSVRSDQIGEIETIKNETLKIEDKNVSNSRDDDKGMESSRNKDLKVCPFKLSFQGKFNAESDGSNKAKSELLEKDLLPQESGKKDVSCNVIDKSSENSNESVVNSNNLLTKSSDNNVIDKSKTTLKESSNTDSQSDSVVHYNGDLKDKNLDSKDAEIEAQDEDFSGGEGNELLGISSDESNQMDTQNGNQEPEMEFDILDEFESNDNDPDPEVRTSDSESEISAEEIDAMLEAGLGDYGKPSVENQHEVKEKVILKARGKDHFEVLPEGWIEVTHNSGIPIYLHKQTRVCCVSKPYFLGPGSTRKHEIPITAIPCLHYMKELEKEKLEAEKELNGDDQGLENKTENSGEVNENGIEDGQTTNHVTENGSLNAEVKSNVTEKNSKVLADGSSNIPKGSNLIFPSAKLESVKDVKVSGSLDHLAVREYCQKRFEFQTITVKRFKTWFGRRKHQKQMRRKQRPFLPDSTQLITCPLPSNTDKSTAIGSSSKREFIMNPVGKSPVCILHEYVQHTLRLQPKYIFKELESASTPYGAVVIINDMEYGTGYGSSKKVAKSEAAKSALEVLIPKIRKFDSDKGNNEEDCQDVEFFDQVRVEDPRISDLSVKAGQPFPYQILLECLKRNYGMGDTEISIRMKNLKHQKNEFIMKVGKHKATVVCKNKRDGKHRASQAILQQLHPHINSWGSLLRMYGKGSCKTLKEKKEEEQRITELQSKACVNKPNLSILNKLKEEMMKYREKMKSKKPIGKLIPERMQLFSISDSNLKSIEL